MNHKEVQKRKMWVTLLLFSTHASTTSDTDQQFFRSKIGELQRNYKDKYDKYVIF